MDMHKQLFYSGIVWLASAVALTIYGCMGMLGTKIPGVEELVSFLSQVDGVYLYAAAFVAIFIEGLYVVGSFFPGSTMVAILAVLSQTGGPITFTFTILSIFVGWCLVGVVNIVVAKAYVKMSSLNTDELVYEVQDRPWTTWYPAFRANYEVAQIAEGGSVRDVLRSSVRVKFWASLVAALGVFLMSLVVDINDLDDEEGFLSVVVVAGISYVVAFIKFRKYRSARNEFIAAV